MRERLVAAFIGVTVLVLVVFGVFRAYSIGNLVKQGEERNIERSAVLIADVVGEEDARVDAAYLETLLEEGEHLEYVASDGTRLAAGADVDNEDPSTISRSEPVGDGGSLTLARPGELVEERVANQLLPLVLLAIAMILLAGVLGYIAAIRLSRPFRDLARAADELGRGRFDLQLPHYSIPEAQAVANAMRVSGTKLDQLVRREREFAVNASHQLRTPITALRLELEDLRLWPETAAPVAAQLDRAVEEVERLSATVADLLNQASGRRAEAVTTINLSALVSDMVDSWRSLVRTAGRTIELEANDAGDAVAVRLAPGPIEQILDVLIENSLVHGSGTITVDATELDNLVRVRVRDEGGAVLADDIFRRPPSSPSATIGLAMGARLAEAIGGRLVLERDESTTFSLKLPRK